ncbi:hypothetical protein HGB13_03760 [bacterium]|nr:hypothetical protein [bacterium]
MPYASQELTDGIIKGLRDGDRELQIKLSVFKNTGQVIDALGSIAFSLVIINRTLSLLTERMISIDTSMDRIDYSLNKIGGDYL